MSLGIPTTNLPAVDRPAPPLPEKDKRKVRNSKPKRSPAKSSRRPRMKLPILVEATLRGFWGIVLFISIFIAALSYMQGCNGMTILIRAGAAALLVGALLWILASVILRGSVELTQKLLDEEAEKIKQERLLKEQKEAEEAEAAAKAAEMAEESQIGQDITA